MKWKHYAKIFNNPIWTGGGGLHCALPSNFLGVTNSKNNFIDHVIDCKFIFMSYGHFKIFFNVPWQLWLILWQFENTSSNILLNKFVLLVNKQDFLPNFKIGLLASFLRFDTQFFAGEPVIVQTLIKFLKNMIFFSFFVVFIW